MITEDKRKLAWETYSTLAEYCKDDNNGKGQFPVMTEIEFWMSISEWTDQQREIYLDRLVSEDVQASVAMLRWSQQPTTFADVDRKAGVTTMGIHDIQVDD